MRVRRSVRDRTAYRTSDDTSSARDDGLAWFKTAFGAFVYDKGYRQAFSMLGFPGPDLPHGAVPAWPARRESDEADGDPRRELRPGMFVEMFAAGSSSRASSPPTTAMRCARTRDRIMGANALRRGARPACGRRRLLRDGSFLAVHSGAGAPACQTRKRARAKSRVLRPAGRCVITTVILPERRERRCS